MTEDKACREAFEVWLLSQSFSSDKDEDGEYEYNLTRSHWKAWQAAWNRRAAKPAVPSDSLHAAAPDGVLVEQLRAALRSVNAVAIERGDKFGACDQIDNDGQPYQSQWFADLLSAAPPLPVAQGVPQWLSPNDPPQTDGQTCVIVEADPGEPSSVIFATWDAKSNTFDTADVGWFNPSEVMCWMIAAPLPVAPTPPAAPKEPTCK